MHDLIPMVPDASLLGVVGVPFIKRAFIYITRPAFWPDVTLVKCTKRVKNPAYDYDTYASRWTTETWYENWVVVRRKVYHRFPIGSDQYDRLSGEYDPTNKYIGIAKLEDEMDDDALTSATAEAQRLAREFRRLEGEPTTVERAQRLLES